MTTIPGAENMTYAPENSLQRIQEYPAVKDTLQTAYELVHRYPITGAAYDKIESISNSIIATVAPRLPLQTVDGYANAGLDYVEKNFPAVKSETNELLKSVRKPADDAVGICKTYADGFQSRIAPVTEPLVARLTSAQQNLAGLQERLNTAIASLPHDKASASEAMNSIFKEVESVTTYVTSNAKELPAHVQSATKPLVDDLGERLAHIRAELTKTEVPIQTRAANVLAYTRESISPVLGSLKDIVTKGLKKAEENGEAAAPKANGTS